MNSILPGVLCNDSTLQIDADAAERRASPNDGAHVGDIELAVSGVAQGEDEKRQQEAAAMDGWRVEGDPTERCILELAALFDTPQSIKQVMSRNPRLAEIPFDSSWKYMATLHRLTPELADSLRYAGGDGKEDEFVPVAAVPPIGAVLSQYPSV